MSNFSLYICVHIDVSEVTELRVEFWEYVHISGFKVGKLDSLKIQ